MTMTQKAAEIRIASGFLSALDKCPNCGDEHDVASQVECRACGYHAGSDLSQEWLGHVEEEMKSIPAGVELVFAHETESGDSDYYYDFSVSPDAGSAAVLANAPLVSCTQCGQSVPSITCSSPTTDTR